MTNTSDELAKLRSENIRLIALLEAHGISWKEPLRIPVTQEPTLRLDRVPYHLHYYSLIQLFIFTFMDVVF